MNGQDKSKEKTVEMRVAELEDKLAQLHITDEEMKAYNKVANLLGGATGSQDPAGVSTNAPVCITPRSIQVCVVPRYINRGIVPRTPRFVCECYECQCGPCGGFSGGFGAGGFGGFGG